MLIIPEISVPGFGLVFGVLVRVARWCYYISANYLSGGGRGLFIVSPGKQLFFRAGSGFMCRRV